MLRSSLLLALSHAERTSSHASPSTSSVEFIVISNIITKFGMRLQFDDDISRSNAFFDQPPSHHTFNPHVETIGAVVQIKKFASCDLTDTVSLLLAML